MSKMATKKQKNKKILPVLLSVAIAAVGFAVIFNFQKVLAVGEGWGAGIWNNFVAGYAENDPTVPSTIGWLKSNSDMNGPCLASGSYGVVFTSGNPESDERYVSGQAWFGIGSETDSGGDCQADLPSLGWLDFGAGSPPFCSGDDCHAARWHKEGYLDGWAQVTSMGDNGWVRLKGTDYGASCDANGVLSGYVWNSGTENTISGNSGLGWIKMDGLKIEECNLGCATTPPLCGTSTYSTCDSSFCTGTGASCISNPVNNFTSWTCSSSCGSLPCHVEPTIPKNGQCGELHNRAICEKDNPPTDKLCADPTTYNNDLDRNGVTATWTCGNDCGEVVECSAKARCGWIETNPQ